MNFPPVGRLEFQPLIYDILKRKFINNLMYFPCYARSMVVTLCYWVNLHIFLPFNGAERQITRK